MDGRFSADRVKLLSGAQMTGSAGSKFILELWEDDTYECRLVGTNPTWGKVTASVGIVLVGGAYIAWSLLEADPTWNGNGFGEVIATFATGASLIIGGVVDLFASAADYLGNIVFPQ